MGDLVGGLVSSVGGGLVKSLFGGGGGGGQVAQGAANIAGGALSANEAQQFAQQLGNTANPFGQYNQQWASTLNQQAGNVLGSNFAFTQNPLSFANNTTNNPYSLGGSTLDNFTAQRTDPLASSLNGQQFGQQINNLVANPDSVYDTAQYKAAFGQGQNAVNSTLAAQGLNASGNQLAALQNYGQSFGQQAYGTQLSQLSGLYGQALAGNQQIYSQAANNANTNLAENQNAFNQQMQVGQLGLQQNNQYFNQLSQLSGLSAGSPTAAAAAQAQVFGNVNSAYQSVGQGVGQVANGIGSMLGGLASGATSGTNSFGFNSGQGNSTSGSISGSGALYGAAAGLDDSSWNYGGSGNTWGF